MNFLSISIKLRWASEWPALALVACLSAAGPAHAQARYSYSADGAEVSDAQTGLVWQRCSQGQSWSGSTCTGSASTYTHEQALTLAKTQPLWRLPNVKELSSLVDRSRSNPSIDATGFPATPPASFWSSSPYVGDASKAWPVNFSDGLVVYGPRSNASHVRLVR